VGKEMKCRIWSDRAHRIENYDTRINNWIAEMEAEGYEVVDTQVRMASDNGGSIHYEPYCVITVWMEEQGIRRR
jgi:hypothetical protein